MGRRSRYGVEAYNNHVPVARLLMAALLLAAVCGAQEHVSFITRDGWTIHADLYGTTDRGVVLVHGGRFDKSSWERQARELVKAGFRALAIDWGFRGNVNAIPG